MDLYLDCQVSMRYVALNADRLRFSPVWCFLSGVKNFREGQEADDAWC